MKIFAVSIKCRTGYESKRDFDACELVYAQNQDDALAKVKERESEDEGYYEYEAEEVDIDKIKNGEIMRVYGKYNW
jgi:hypothetical protein